MHHEAFTSGQFDTHFVKKYFRPEVLLTSNEDEALVAAIIMEKLLGEKAFHQNGQILAEGTSAWVKNRKAL